MKFVVAIVLVVASLSSAESPRSRAFARQTEAAGDAGYAPRGWRPSGAEFNLPQRSQPQQVYNNAPPQTYGGPETTYYGPPKEQYGPPEESEAVPTETPSATEGFSEGVTEESTEPQAENVQRIRSKKPEKLQNEQTKPVFFVVPQRENLIYLQQSAPLVTVPQPKYLASLQAVPYSTFSSQIVTPFTGSYVQLYQ